MTNQTVVDFKLEAGWNLARKIEHVISDLEKINQNIYYEIIQVVPYGIENFTLVLNSLKKS